MIGFEDYIRYARGYWSAIARQAGAITPGEQNQADLAEHDAGELLRDIDRDWLSQNLLVDFGCGDGRLSPLIAKAAGWYFGFDINYPSIMRCRELNTPKATFLLLNSLNQLNIQPGLVVSWTVFMHLPEDFFNEALLSIAQVLPPGGRFAFQLNGQDDLIEHRYDRVPPDDLWTSRWYPDSHIRAKLDWAGFVIQREATSPTTAWLCSKA